MNKNDPAGATDADDPGQPDVADNLPDVGENNSIRRESAATDDKKAFLICENCNKLIAAREEAAHLLEDAASTREQEIHVA